MRKAGQWLKRDDDAMIRIDRVANGQVYYVSWLPDQRIGTPQRTTFDNFEDGVAKDGLEPCGPCGLPLPPRVVKRGVQTAVS